MGLFTEMVQSLVGTSAMDAHFTAAQVVKPKVMNTQMQAGEFLGSKPVTKSAVKTAFETPPADANKNKTKTGGDGEEGK